MLNDIEKWRIENLAKFGFADRYIAARTFDIKPASVSDAEIARVQHHRLKQRILLTNWRQGLSLTAQKYAGEAIRGKKKERTRPRSRRTFRRKSA